MQLKPVDDLSEADLIRELLYAYGVLVSGSRPPSDAERDVLTERSRQLAEQLLPS